MKSMRLRPAAIFLLPTNEVCEGYVFTPVCHSVHRGGGCLGPGPRGRLGGLARQGVEVQAQGEVGGSGWGVSRQVRGREKHEIYVAASCSHLFTANKRSL